MTVNRRFIPTHSRRREIPKPRLRRRLREVDGSDGIGVMATGDPGLDLIGIIAGSNLGGFDAVGRGREE